MIKAEFSFNLTWPPLSLIFIKMITNLDFFIPETRIWLQNSGFLKIPLFILKMLFQKKNTYPEVIF